MFFVVLLLAMSWVTVRASLHESVVTAAGPLLKSPWGLATLADAYFGFLTFYLWILYKEVRWLSRLVWLVAILLLGNFAMAAFALRELARMKPGATMADVLAGRNG